MSLRPSSRRAAAPSIAAERNRAFHWGGCFVLLFSAATARAQTLDWNNPSGGGWSTGANWTPAGPPGAGSTARFALANTFTVSLSANVATSILTINSGDITLQLGGFSLQLTNTVNNGMGATNTASALRVISGTFQPGNFSVGGNTGSNSTLTLDTGSVTTVGSGVFFTGTNGTGLTRVINGAKLTTNGSTGLGVNQTGLGSAIVSGSGSEWTVNNALRVGINGSGALEVSNGGKVAATSTIIGENQTGIGSITVGGAGALFTSQGQTDIGGSSALFPSLSGTLTVNTGATVALNGATNFRTNATVNMNGGTLQLNTLTVAPGAAFNWNGGTVQIASAASLTDSVLDWLTGGTSTLAAGRALTASTGILNLDSGLIVNGGTLTAPEINVNAPLTIGAFGTLNGTSSISIGAGQVLQVEEFGTLEAGDFIVNNGGLIQLNGPAAIVTGFTANNFGTVQGTGRFAGGMNNGIGGTFRVRSGDYLVIEGGGLTSPGRIELSGGTIEFTHVLSNLGSGIISGRGEFRSSTSNPGGVGLSKVRSEQMGDSFFRAHG